MMEPLLRISGLHVAYGKAHVVHGVDLAVGAGEFVVMLGRNGAGKSTILHAASGLIPKASGRIEFAGADLSAAAPRDVVRAGLIQVLEGHRVFTGLSVEDNLLIGTYAAPQREPGDLERMYTMFPELAQRRQLPAAKLSGGQQQILAVAQGLIARPKLLILDEPSGGLAPIIVDRILDVLTLLCKEGMSVLLVEQLVEKALKHAHRCYLVETGRIVGEGKAQDIRGSDILHRVYLGHT